MQVSHKDQGAWSDTEYERWRINANERCDKLETSIKREIDNAMQKETQSLSDEKREKRRQHVDEQIANPLRERVKVLRDYVESQQKQQGFLEASAAAAVGVVQRGAGRGRDKRGP